MQRREAGGVPERTELQQYSFIRRGHVNMRRGLQIKKKKSKNTV